MTIQPDAVEQYRTEIAGPDPGVAAAPATAVRPVAGFAAAGRPRLLPRQTFTVEVWVDDAGGRIAATQVVHLETQVTDAWYGWDSRRLLEFLGDGIGGAGLTDHGFVTAIAPPAVGLADPVNPVYASDIPVPSPDPSEALTEGTHPEPATTTRAAAENGPTV